MNDKFAFLLSTRFHAMIIGAVVLYLKTKGLIAEPEMVLIETILMGFISVRTVDRMGEKIGGE